MSCNTRNVAEGQPKPDAAQREAKADAAQREAKPDALTVGIVGGVVVAVVTALLGKVNRWGGALLVLVAYVALLSTAREFQEVREKSLGHPVSLATIVLQLTFMYAVALGALAVFFRLFLD